MKTTLRCPALLLCAAALVGCASDNESSVRENAEARIVDELIVDGAPAIVFAHPTAVGPTDELSPYAFSDHDAESGVPTEPISIGADSWLYWIDDRPGATFVHPNRFVLVDQQTGEFTISDAQTWPVLNGEGLWVDEGAYWDEENWVYSSEQSRMRRATIKAPATVVDDELTCGGTKGRALVIDGWEPGETQKDTFRMDAEDMASTLDVAGFDTSTYGPMGEMGYDGANDRPSLEAWFTKQAAEMKAGETLFVFVSGHGAVINNKTVVGTVWEADLASWLAKFDADVEIIVVINGCHSGGMLDSLSCSADYAAAATSESLPSYGDLDSGETINPRDKGSEFVSSICGAMFELLTSPADVARIGEEAKADGDGFWEEFMEEAFDDSKALDEAVRRGLTMPQAQTGVDAKTKPAPAAVEAPECDPTTTPNPDPGPSSACDDPGLEDMRIFVNILAGTDAYPSVCGDAGQEPKENSVDHSDGTKSTTAEGEVDLYLRWDWRGCYDAEGIGGCSSESPAGHDHAHGQRGLAPANRDLASILELPCGESEIGTTMCPDMGAPQTGDYYVVAGVFDAPVGVDGSMLYQYGFVFDADGDPSNNYTPDPAYPKDFFADSDRWYVAGSDSVGGWAMQVTDARDGAFTSVPSGARIVATGNTLALIVPADELPATDPTYRITAFRHAGDWGAQQPWSADVVPAVGEPMLSL